MNGAAALGRNAAKSKSDVANGAAKSRRRLTSQLLAATSVIALSAALPSLVFAQSAVPAGCTPNPAVNGSTVNCVAPPDPIDNIATTVDDLTINIGNASTPTNILSPAPALDGISMTGGGTQTLNINNAASTVTGTYRGVYISVPVLAGDVTITSEGSITGQMGGIRAINGGGALTINTAAVTGTTGDGIFARNDSGTDLAITATGLVKGGNNGIFADHSGSGALTINTAAVTGTGAVGIFAATNAGTNLTITATGAVQGGGGTGIFADHDGSGALTINAVAVTGAGTGIFANANAGTDLTIAATGAVEGGGTGVFANHDGSGALTVNTVAVKGAGTGIFAHNNVGTDLTITATGAVEGGGAGIFADQEGSGALTINTAAVTGTTGAGIDAFSLGDGLSITSTGTVKGGEDGVYAINANSGAFTISATDVDGAMQDGIYALNFGDGLSINTTGAVNGGIDGIHGVNAVAGAFAISATDIDGAMQDGIYALNFGTSLSITATGVVKGGQYGIEGVNNGTGAFTINVKDVDGATDDGIYALNFGSSLSITATGAVSGGEEGIYAVNFGTGPISISAVDVTGNGDDAIDAINLGDSSMSIDTTGAVFGVDDGIDAINAGSATDLSITTAGGVTGGQSGIEAYQYGSGVSAITIAGAVTGQTEQGLYSVSATGASITVTPTGVVTGAQNGILIDDAPGMTTLLTNQGAITGNIGINSSFSSGSVQVTTSGLIIGTGGTAIDFGTGDDILTILTGAGFGSTIAFGTGANQLNVCADSAVSFDVSVAPGGTLDFLDCTSQGTVAFNGTTVASVDPNTGFAQLNDTFIDVSSTIQGTLELETGGLGLALANARDAMPYQVASLDASGFRMSDEKGAWLRGMGGYIERDGDGGESDSDHRFYGIVGGLDIYKGQDISVGAFGGYVSSDLEVDNNIFDIESDRYLGGAYFASAIGQWSLNGSAIGGVGSHEQVRAHNGGLESARADYDSTFISGGIATERTFGETLNEFGLRPSFGVLYSAEFLDGYTESGIATPLTTQDRTVHGVTGFAELAVVTVCTIKEHDLLGFEVRAGAEGRQIFGDDISGTLLGTSLSFEPAGKETTLDGYLGIGVEGAFQNMLAVFADVEGRKGTETEAAVKAQAGVKWLF